MKVLILSAIVLLSVNTLATELDEEIQHRLYTEIHLNNESCTDNVTVKSLLPIKVSDGINCEITLEEIDGKRNGYIIMRYISSYIPTPTELVLVQPVETKFQHSWLYAYTES